MNSLIQRGESVVCCWLLICGRAGRAYYIDRSQRTAVENPYILKVIRCQFGDTLRRSCFTPLSPDRSRFEERLRWHSNVLSSD